MLGKLCQKTVQSPTISSTNENQTLLFSKKLTTTKQTPYLSHQSTITSTSSKHWHSHTRIHSFLPKSWPNTFQKSLWFHCHHIFAKEHSRCNTVISVFKNINKNKNSIMNYFVSWWVNTTNSPQSRFLLLVTSTLKSQHLVLSLKMIKFMGEKCDMFCQHSSNSKIINQKHTNTRLHWPNGSQNRRTSSLDFATTNSSSSHITHKTWKVENNKAQIMSWSGTNFLINIPYKKTE